MTVAPFPPNEVETVENALLGGRVRLRQPARGYRAGMDAALLAAAVAAEPGQRVIEAGCGAGAVLMQIAARRPEVALTGLERDPTMAALARENAVLNGAEARIVEGDVATGFRALDLPVFDWAVSNPPFFDDPGALRAPAPGKRGAWMADDGLKAWTTFLLKSVREGGRIVVIHRADRLADLLALLGETGRVVRGARGASPCRRPGETGAGAGDQDRAGPIAAVATSGAARPVGEQRHTAEAEAILQGAAALGF